MSRNLKTATNGPILRAKPLQPLQPLQPLNKDIEYCRQSLQRHDYPAYLLSLFMPMRAREGLWTLGAFKCLLDQIPHTVTQPALGYMRLTWWRDEITANKATKGQPVLNALHMMQVEKHDLITFINTYEAIIENRDTALDIEPFDKLIEKILGSDTARYKKLQSTQTAMMKKHHGTPLEFNPPFMALRLWFKNLMLS